MAIMEGEGVYQTASLQVFHGNYWKVRGYVGVYQTASLQVFHGNYWSCQSSLGGGKQHLAAAVPISG